MKIIGTVVENIVVQKKVEIEVPDSIVEQANAGDEDADKVIEDAIRKAAYDKNLLDFEDEHGWEGVGDTLNLDIEWEEKS